MVCEGGGGGGGGGEAAAAGEGVSQEKGFPTEKVDIDMDLHDQAHSELALEGFDFPEMLSPDVLKHPEVQENEENKEKDDARMLEVWIHMTKTQFTHDDSHHQHPSNLVSAVRNTTHRVEDQEEEENEEQTDSVARSDTETSTASEKTNPRRRQRCRFRNC